METPKVLVIKNFIAFLLGVFLIGYQNFQDTNQPYYLLVGGYILLSLYHALRFGMKHYGNLFSIVVFWFLPFALVFAIFVSSIAGFITSVPRFLYYIYLWSKQGPRTRVSGKHQPRTNNVVRFQPKSR